MTEELAKRKVEQLRILAQAGLLRRMTETGELKLLVDNDMLDSFIEQLLVRANIAP